MGGNGYMSRGYATYTYRDMEPTQDDYWNEASYGYSDHLCRPVVVDAEGKKLPIIFYTESQSNQGYVTKRETIVELEHVRMSRSQDMPHQVEQFLTKVHNEASRPTRPYTYTTANSAGYANVGDWNKPSSFGRRDKDLDGYTNSYKNDRITEPTTINNRRGWERPSDHRGWTRTIPPSYSLAKPTNGIDEALDFMKEAIRSVSITDDAPGGKSSSVIAAAPQPPFTTPKDTYTETIASSVTGAVPQPWFTATKDSYPGTNSQSSSFTAVVSQPQFTAPKDNYSETNGRSSPVTAAAPQSRFIAPKDTYTETINESSTVNGAAPKPGFTAPKDTYLGTSGQSPSVTASALEPRYTAPKDNYPETNGRSSTVTAAVPQSRFITSKDTYPGTNGWSSSVTPSTLESEYTAPKDTYAETIGGSSSIAAAPRSQFTAPKDTYKETIEGSSSIPAVPRRQFSIPSSIVPKKDTHIETIDSREAARKYSQPGATIDSREAARRYSQPFRTIDSKEAMKKYGGRFVP